MLEIKGLFDIGIIYVDDGLVEGEDAVHRDKSLV